MKACAALLLAGALALSASAQVADQLGYQVYSPSAWDDQWVRNAVFGTCDLVKSGYDFGAGVTIYIIDSGIDSTHAEFEGLADGQIRSLVIPEFADQAEKDTSGSGTHMASLIVGKTYGLANKSKIVSVRVYQEGVVNTNEAQLISGFNKAQADWIANGKSDKAIFLMTSSSETTFTYGDFCCDEQIVWGAQCGTYYGVRCVAPDLGCLSAEQKAMKDELCYNRLDFAIKGYKEDYNMNIVVSAGNKAQDACDSSPARSANAVTVGAMKANLDLADNANRGTCVDLLAYGVDIPGGFLKDDQRYMRNSSRTSTPSAIVSALLSVLMSKPGVTFDMAVNAIKRRDDNGEIKTDGITQTGISCPATDDNFTIPGGGGGNTDATPTPVPTPTPMPTVAPTESPGTDDNFTIPGGGGGNTDATPTPVPTVAPTESPDVEGPTGEDYNCTDHPLGFPSKGRANVLVIGNAVSDNAQFDGLTIVSGAANFVKCHFGLRSKEEGYDGKGLLRVEWDMSITDSMVHDSLAFCQTLESKAGSQCVPGSGSECIEGGHDFDWNFELLGIENARFHEVYGVLSSNPNGQVNGKKLVGTNSQVNVFTLDGDNVLKGVNLVDVPDDSTVIINVLGKNPSFVNYNLPQKIHGPKTLLNFPEAETVTMKNSWIPASILTVGELKLENCKIRGQVVCGGLQSTKTKYFMEIFSGRALYPDCTPIYLPTRRVEKPIEIN